MFDAEEVAVIRREADEIFAEDRNGGPITSATQYVQPFFERKPYLSTLVEDDRVYQIGVDLLGPDFILLPDRGPGEDRRHTLARGRRAPVTSRWRSRSTSTWTS